MRDGHYDVGHEDMNQRQIEPITTEFFFTFARLEYALKATGFLVNNSRVAKADWRRFADVIRSRFDVNATAQIKEAIEYFLQHPPKKQVVSNGHLEWNDTQPDHNSDLDLLLAQIGRVRNNLFHGGKFRGRYFAEPERATSLMRHALTILGYCLTLSPDVREAFEH